MIKNLNEPVRNLMGAAVLVTVTLLSLSAPFHLNSNTSPAAPTSYSIPLMETGCCA
jgi:hypothetical protein